MSGIVEEADTKSAAVSLAWHKLFSCKAADHETQLMAKVLSVTKDEALHALRTHLLPLFAAESSTLVIVTPTSKVQSVAGAFGCSVVQEDSLTDVFPPLCVADTLEPADAPVECAPVSAVSRFGFGWARGGKLNCECPRCDKPAPAL